MKIKNKGEEIFKVDTAGNVFAKNAFLQDGTFTGDIYSGPLELSSRQPNSKTIEIKKNETIEQLVKKYGDCSFFCSSLKGIMGIVKISIYQSSTTSALYGTKREYTHGSIGAWRTIIVPAGYFTKSISTLKIYLKNSEKEYRYQVVSNINQTDKLANISISVGQKVEDTRIEIDTIVQAREGAKTYKLKDIPTMPLSEKGVVWVDENGFLKLS